MSDDWNTINANRGRVLGREAEALRKRYLQHREMLGRLTSEAPTEHLAKEYARLQTEIDAAVAKIDGLERRAASDASTEPAAPMPSAAPLRTSPLTSPMTMKGAGTWQSTPITPASLPETNDSGVGLRSTLIVLAGLAVIGIIAALLWYFVSIEKPQASTHDLPETSTTPVITETAAPAPPLATLSVTPADFNYGTIRKGTRATHQFTLSNGSDAPITIATSRSTCRCLWFRHAPTIPAHGTTSLTVTVDGGRAKKGAVDEQVEVSAKANPQATATIHVVAEVQ